MYRRLNCLNSILENKNGNSDMDNWNLADLVTLTCQKGTITTAAV